MKIVLSLAEALNLIRDHATFDGFEDDASFEIVIEGHEVSVGETDNTNTKSNDEPKPRQKRKRRTKAEIAADAPVDTQEQLDDIVTEVANEITADTAVDEVLPTEQSHTESSDIELGSTTVVDTEMSLIDQVLAEEEEEESLFEVAEQVEEPVAAVDLPADAVIDTSAPLFT